MNPAILKPVGGLEDVDVQSAGSPQFPSPFFLDEATLFGAWRAATHAGHTHDENNLFLAQMKAVKWCFEPSKIIESSIWRCCQLNKGKVSVCVCVFVCLCLWS